MQTRAKYADLWNAYIVCWLFFVFFVIFAYDCVLKKKTARMGRKGTKDAQTADMECPHWPHETLNAICNIAQSPVNTA